MTVHVVPFTSERAGGLEPFSLRSGSSTNADPLTVSSADAEPMHTAELDGSGSTTSAAQLFPCRTGWAMRTEQAPKAPNGTIQNEMRRTFHFRAKPPQTDCGGLQNLPFSAARSMLDLNRKSFVMRIGRTLLFATVLAVGTIASLPHLCGEGPAGTAAAASPDSFSCIDHFNALLAQAKASLVKGNRGAAINSLIAARTQLRTCQEQEQRNSTAAVAVALNFAQSASAE